MLRFAVSIMLFVLAADARHAAHIPCTVPTLLARLSKHFTCLPFATLANRSSIYWNAEQDKLGTYVAPGHGKYGCYEKSVAPSASWGGASVSEVVWVEGGCHGHFECGFNLTTYCGGSPARKNCTCTPGVKQPPHLRPPWYGSS